MSKIVSSTATLVTLVFAALLTTAPPASAEWNPAQAPGGGASRGAEAVTNTSSPTQALVIGTIAFVIMVGAGAAVLWFTARNRRHEPR